MDKGFKIFLRTKGLDVKICYQYLQEQGHTDSFKHIKTNWQHFSSWVDRGIKSGKLKGNVVSTFNLDNLSEKGKKAWLRKKDQQDLAKVRKAWDSYSIESKALIQEWKKITQIGVAWRPTFKDHVRTVFNISGIEFEDYLSHATENSEQFINAIKKFKKYDTF